MRFVSFVCVLLLILSFSCTKKPTLSESKNYEEFKTICVAQCCENDINKSGFLGAFVQKSDTASRCICANVSLMMFVEQYKFIPVPNSFDGLWEFEFCPDIIEKIEFNKSE